MALEIPNIIDCNAKNCVYNKQNQCHAFAITVGDEEPRCDTYCSSQTKGGINEVTGKVGACKVCDCIHNKSFECTAQGIHITINHGTPDCSTYEHL
ncbi:MAG: DUF1540 domain-containing protein [Fibrobacter sp.]|nr:DUF1540 domain-containing protein [Fibrobacter sp.]